MGFPGGVVGGIVTMAAGISVGFLLLLVACTAKSGWNYHPMYILIFYGALPIPILIAKLCLSDSFSSDSTNDSCRNFLLFILTGLIISCYAFPVTLHVAKYGVLEFAQVICVWAGNTVVIAVTIFMFYKAYEEDDFGL